MKALIKPQLQHHISPLQNIANGLSKHGVKYDLFSREKLDSIKSYDFGVVWGLKNALLLKQYGIKNVLIIENAYLNNIQGPNKEWVSCGWNGLNGRADFCNKNSQSDRWNKHFNDGRLLEYSDGKYILIPLQIQHDQSLKYVNKNISYQRICEEIRKFTDLPIIIKDHPTRPGTQRKIISIKNLKYIDPKIPIEKAIKYAKVVVTINSNAGVDSVIAGKPVINMDCGSMVWDIAERDFTRINLPHWPDRTQWCNDIAYAQWHPTELESGEAWEHLKIKINNDKENCI